ncbi:MAG: hypothetical protein QXI93_02290 [Candidatus Methanomethylicia archaeon]
MKRIAIFLGKFVFYFYAFIWTLKPRKAYTMHDVLKLLYYDFLFLREEDIEIVKITEDELVTRSRNPCPILKLALKLNLDTKYVCREISEPVCKYVLKKLNPNLIFERNYDHIRPYKNSCEERIYKGK